MAVTKDHMITYYEQTFQMQGSQHRKARTLGTKKPEEAHRHERVEASPQDAQDINSGTGGQCTAYKREGLAINIWPAALFAGEGRTPSTLVTVAPPARDRAWA